MLPRSGNSGSGVEGKATRHKSGMSRMFVSHVMRRAVENRVPPPCVCPRRAWRGWPLGGKGEGEAERLDSLTLVGTFVVIPPKRVPSPRIACLADTDEGLGAEWREARKRWACGYMEVVAAPPDAGRGWSRDQCDPVSRIVRNMGPSLAYRRKRKAACCASSNRSTGQRLSGCPLPHSGP